MINLLRTYKAVPYTPEALRLLANGWKLPDGLEVPSSGNSGQDLSTRLEDAKKALVGVEDLILRTSSEAEKIILHNAVRLSIIELRQELTEEARANMPRVIVRYSEAQQIMEEILYAAIKIRTGKSHVPVNNIHGYADEPKLVVTCLLDAEGQDHDSHGVDRILGYAKAIMEGKVNPQGKVELIKEAYGKLSFTGGGTFGQVAVQIALDQGLERMRKLEAGSLLAVTVRQAYHAGRLEWILRQAVREGHSCFAMFNVGGWGRSAPEPDGMEPRWGTNPLGGGVSTGIGEDGLIGDLATTKWPEGKIRVAFLNDLVVPLGIVRTPEGYPSIEPAGIYKDVGVPDLMVPMGDYKGAVLGELVELFTDAVSERKPGEVSHPTGNNLVLFLCKGNESVFKSMTEKLRVIESCPTASGNPVRRPGAVGLQKLEIAKEEGLHIAEGTWAKVLKQHEELCYRSINRN